MHTVLQNQSLIVSVYMQDFRYMATSDLQNELLKPTFRVEQHIEKKLCAAVLLQLQDISGDISALAVKW